MEAGAGAHPGDAARPLEETTFAVVDVETSGLSARRHRLLQVAVVIARADGTIVEAWSTYVKPRFRYLARLGPRRIHGISRRRLKGAPLLAAVVEQLEPRLAGHALTAHNLAFDRAFLRASVHRSGRRLPASPEVCTLNISRRLDPDNAQSHRLGDLCARYGISLDRAHDALADATATAALLPHLIAASGATTLAELEALSLRIERAPAEPSPDPVPATPPARPR